MANGSSMEIREYYSHLNGYEWLRYRRKNVWGEVEDSLRAVNAHDLRTKESREVGKKGVMLYSPGGINSALRQELQSRGWESMRTSYYVTDDAEITRKLIERDPEDQKRYLEERGKEPIYSYNETDFVKNRVAVEVQFGKYSFIGYDLFVKHTAFFVSGQIDAAIEIVPMKAMQNEMSSGPGYYESALYDLVRQGRSSPPVPLVLVGIAPEEESEDR